MKRTNRKMIVFSTVNSSFPFEIIKRIKRMCGIKIFAIFAVRTFNFAAVLLCVRADAFMLYVTLKTEGAL